MVIMEKRSVNDGEVLNTVVVKYDELSHDVLASITANPQYLQSKNLQ